MPYDSDEIDPISNHSHILNPLANIFCPSVSSNNISIFNNFNHNSHINILYANLQGMLESNHFDEFKNEIGYVKNIHLLVIVESWLRNNINNNRTIQINGYNIFRSDRKSSPNDNNKGGGIVIYAKTHLHVNILENSYHNNSKIDNAEFLMIEILTKRGKFVVCAIYRTSKCSVNHTKKLFNLIVKNCAIYPNAIIIGDFNIDLLKPKNNLGCLNDNFKLINHFCPTHYWPNANPSLIDIALTRNLDCVKLFSHYNLLPTTHHDMLLISYGICPKMGKIKNEFSYHNYDKIKHNELIHHASKFDWSHFYESIEINEKVNIIYKFYNTLFTSHVPLVKVKIKSSTKSWFNRELTILIKERNKFYRFYKYHQMAGNQYFSEKLFENFKILNKKTKNYINKLKTQNFVDDLNKAKSCKQKWDVIKSTGCSNQRKSIEISDNIEIESLNNHYINIHTSSIQIFPIYPHSNISFHFDNIIPKDIISAIKYIKSNAIGHDNISIRFLKILLPFLQDPLTHIFNFSLKNSIFPKAWNIIKIHSIAKNNNPTTAKDTRPITINNLFTKIFCSILNTQIKTFLNDYNILSQYQSGFRNGLSCNTALIRVSEDVRMNILNKNITIMVLLDIKSAYPSVSHELLFHILKSIGFHDNTLKWISSFFRNKYQYVCIADKKSKMNLINCGLLQGDNLSQTFFSIVINNIVKCVSQCKIHLYADDVVIYFDSTIENINHSIQTINHEINNINKWIEAHGMQLNVTKTRAILIGSKNQVNLINKMTINQICVNNSNIPFSSEIKYLGFHFNNHFDANSHINSIIKKVNFSLNKIKHCRNSIPKSTKTNIIKCIINPIFDYASIIYHGYNIHGTNENSKRLQKVQNNCIRFICKISRFDHVTPYLNELKILNASNSRVFLICCILHKFLIYNPPIYLNDIFIKNNNNTRNGTNLLSLKVNQIRKTGDQFLLSHCATSLWNNLPHKLREIKIHNIFRNKLSNHLFENQNLNNT